MNGKLLFAPDLQAALRMHQESDAIATMIVKEVPVGDRLAAVEIDAAGRVRRLLGQPSDTGAHGPLRSTMYASVCLLAARAHRDLPQRGCLIRDAYRHWVDRGERVMAYVEQASFRDVGMSHWHYWEANMALLSGRERWPGVVPDAREVLCDERAQLGAGVVLVQSVIGAGARVAAGTQLRRCVVWPDARVDTDLEDTVVLSDGRQVAIREPAAPR
jgi:mannose-1-phosphate guanylyltransferase